MLGNKYNYADSIIVGIANDLYKHEKIATIVTDGFNIQFDKEKALSVGAEQDS
ncbi:hypothetical protein [Alkalibaculum sporogenes]|uniref:hypothetical protein n=1 Tax=Alkalibaculum sporogenes TaxID=2655001 RepID=UPI00187B953E|nr:hypothetical protein [Alkalibaculum sporogenes]